MKNAVLSFLRLMEARIPPPTGHHALVAAQYGSDEDGWKDRLCLAIRHGAGVSNFFLDEGEMEAPEDTADAIAGMLRNEGHL